MLPEWVVPTVVMLMAFYGLAGEAREYFRRPPSADEFRKLFLRAWSYAALLAFGTVNLLLYMSAFEVRSHAMLVLLGVVFGFWIAGYPVSRMAARMYRRAQVPDDYAEDGSGNPIAAPAPEAADQRIETWDDLVRAQRSRSDHSSHGP